MLECGWCVAQAIGHPQELVDTHASNGESRVLAGLLCHLNLPESTLEVHAREVVGAHHTLHGFLHPRQGEGILLGLLVQEAEVNTEAEGAVLLPDQHHGITPWRP